MVCLLHCPIRTSERIITVKTPYVKCVTSFSISHKTNWSKVAFFQFFLPSPRRQTVSLVKPCAYRSVWQHHAEWMLPLLVLAFVLLFILLILLTGIYCYFCFYYVLSWAFNLHLHCKFSLKSCSFPNIWCLPQDLSYSFHAFGNESFNRYGDQAHSPTDGKKALFSFGNSQSI